MYPHVTQFETLELMWARQVQEQRETHAGPRPSSRRDATRRGGMPPRYKLALLTWAGAYVVITLMLELLGPTMASWPLELRTLVLSVVMVVSLTWLLMPALTRLFRPWLDPTA